MSNEIELCECELCDKAFDIETMTMMGEIWACPGCMDEWSATFKACDHAWEDGHHDGVSGKFCDKCSGFVEDSDFPVLFPSPSQGRGGAV